MSEEEKPKSKRLASKILYSIILGLIGIFLLALITTFAITNYFPELNFLNLFTIVFVGILILFFCYYVIEYC